MAPKKRKKSSQCGSNKKAKVQPLIDKPWPTAHMDTKTRQVDRQAVRRQPSATVTRASLAATTDNTNTINDLDVDRVIADNYRVIEEALTNSGHSWSTATDPMFPDLLSQYLPNDFQPSEDDFSDLKATIASTSAAEVAIDELDVEPIIFGQTEPVLQPTPVPPEEVGASLPVKPTEAPIPVVLQPPRHPKRHPVRAEQISEEQRANLAIIRRSIDTMDICFQPSASSKGVLIGFFGMISHRRARLTGVMKVAGHAQYKRGGIGGTTARFLHSLVVMSGTITLHVDNEQLRLGEEDLVVIPRRRHYFLRNESSNQCLLFFNISV